MVGLVSLGPPYKLFPAAIPPRFRHDLPPCPIRGMLSELMLNLRRTLQSVFRHAQDDALDQALQHPEVDRKVIAVLLTTCIILTLQQYVFRGGSFDSLPGVLADGSASRTWPSGSTA